MKINQFYVPTISFFLILSSCKENHANAQKTGNDGSVETENPNSDYRPAFQGQTRIKAVKTTTAYSVEVLNKDLGRPWGIINLPDGRFLITDKNGHMNVVSTDGKQISKIEGFPKVDSKGQGGMLDVSNLGGYSGTITSTAYIHINEMGKTTEVTTSGENEILNRELLKTVTEISNETNWKPAMKDGKAIASVLKIPATMTFTRP